MATSLVPKAALYYEHGLNVLFDGDHGTGKTQTVREMAKDLGITVKYYSCGTLDPWSDLTGIPTPVKDANGLDMIKYLRPHDIDDADLIFFDEMNRAEPKVLNAIFEITQFHTINGEPLPKLKACWAAVNPPKGDYQVQEMDPALVDRFHVYIHLDPNPATPYYTERFSALAGVTPQQAKKVAQALVQWHDEHKKKYLNEKVEDYDWKNYVSPRKLEDIGRVSLLVGDANDVLHFLPPGGKYDVNKLKQLLNKAIIGDSYGKSNKAGGAPTDGIEYDPIWIRFNIDTVVETMQDPACTDETKERVIGAMDSVTAEEWSEVMNRLADDVELEPMWVEAAYLRLNKQVRDKINKEELAAPGSKLDRMIWKYPDTVQ